ncbi:hypothetical protein JCM1841_003600 [Sporobolomyces salmonicolor]
MRTTTTALFALLLVLPSALARPAGADGLNALNGLDDINTIDKFNKGDFGNGIGSLGTEFGLDDDKKQVTPLKVAPVQTEEVKPVDGKSKTEIKPHDGDDGRHEKKLKDGTVVHTYTYDSDKPNDGKGKEGDGIGSFDDGFDGIF